MAQGISKNNEALERSDKRLELAQAAEEIRTAADFARFMTSVMSALIAKDIDAATASAICGTANTMLKAIEMQLRYSKGKALQLTGEGESASKTGTPPISRKVNSRHKWCQECYLEGRSYIQATHYDGDDPLCEMCFRKRGVEEYA